MRRVGRAVLLGVLALVAFIFVNNTVLLAAPRSGRPMILAHRGMAQTFPSDGLTNDTCTATRIYPPTHEFLENTIPSMREAF